MSCADCDKEQETREKEYYFRVDTANVLMFGCKKHIAALQEKLRAK